MYTNNSPNDSKDLVGIAEYEIKILERPSSVTSAAILNELEAWRERFPQYKHRPQDGMVALK